ncbi:MAG: hypothetical protein H0X16_11250 [Chloroflexi bacterium]|nr:hypothetical protein [Chloroflexota bacterium]
MITEERTNGTDRRDRQTCLLIESLASLERVVEESSEDDQRLFNALSVDLVRCLG